MDNIVTLLKSKLVENIQSKVRGNNVALLLSGGVDSTCLLFILQELGYDITAYTFHLEGVESTDLFRARQIARKFSVRHEIVELPNKVDELIKDLIELYNKYPEMSTKTDFECFWPLWRTFHKVGENNIVTGLGCDGLFGLSKKAMIHYREHPIKFREARLANIENRRYAQLQLCDKFSKLNPGTIIISPFREANVIRYLSQFNWQDLNEPRQKWIIVYMFMNKFDLIGAPKHLNLQCGDSEIQYLFEKLVTHKINKKKSKSSIGVINQIIDKYCGIDLVSDLKHTN